MNQALILNLDNEPVRFTPDGKVSVLDAIRAVSNSNHPLSLWENLKKEHPEILLHCEDYSFQKEGPAPVVDSEGWQRIWILLPDYFSDPTSQQRKDT